MKDPYAALPPVALLTAFALSCGEPQPAVEAPALGLPPVTQFTTDPAIERDAAWSPDGSEILFGQPLEVLEDIFIVDVRSLIHR